MPNTEQPAGSPAVAGQTLTFDPAAAGWEPYRDEGFIGLVGPFWARQSGDSYRYAFTAEPKHHNRRGVERADQADETLIAVRLPARGRGIEDHGLTGDGGRTSRLFSIRHWRNSH